MNVEEWVLLEDGAQWRQQTCPAPGSSEALNLLDDAPASRQLLPAPAVSDVTPCECQSELEPGESALCSLQSCEIS